MGSDIKATYDGEFENCRVHLVFTNNDGHKYSAEIHPGRNGFSGDFYDQTKYEQDLLHNTFPPLRYRTTAPLHASTLSSNHSCTHII